MGAAAKIEMFPDEVFLRAAIKDGRAVKKELSLKAIGTPDTRLQQRVEMNVDHVRKLERILHDDGNLRPIIVFEEQEPYKLHVADGFHRHEAHKNAKRSSIWAWVIQGTYRDAMIYSTMCNQDMCLKRTPEDIKKAVFTLLDDEEWWRKSDTMIGNHCGVSSGTVSKYRLEHSVAQGVPLPKTVETGDGTHRKYKKGTEPHVVRYKNKSGSIGFRTTINSKISWLGQNEEEAKKKASHLFAEAGKTKASLGKISCVHRRLQRLGFLFSVPGLRDASHRGLGGVLKGYGLVLVSEGFDRASGGSLSPAVPTAVGRVLLARQLIDPSARAVVVCYVEDAPPELIEAGRAIGVEFLTPDELVASLKGEESTDTA